jgi:hypothetical protein
VLHPLRIVAAQRRCRVIGRMLVIAHHVGAAALVAGRGPLDGCLGGFDQVVDLERLDASRVEDPRLVRCSNNFKPSN